MTLNSYQNKKSQKRNTQLKRFSTYHLKYGLEYKFKGRQKKGANRQVVVYKCLDCGKQVESTLDLAWAYKFRCNDCRLKGVSKPLFYTEDTQKKEVKNNALYNKLNTNSVKKCVHCGKVLDTSMFHKCNSTKDGLQSWCKDCQAEYYKNRKDLLGDINKTNIQEPSILIYKSPSLFSKGITNGLITLFKSLMHKQKEINVPLKKVVSINMQDNNLNIKYRE